MPLFESISLTEQNKTSPYYEIALKLNKGIAILNDYQRFEAGLKAQVLLQKAAEMHVQGIANTAIKVEELREVIDGLKVLMPLEYEVRYREKQYLDLNDLDRQLALVTKTSANDPKIHKSKQAEITALHKQIASYGGFVTLKANQLATVAEMLELIMGTISEELTTLETQGQLAEDATKQALQQALEAMLEARTKISGLMLHTIVISRANSSERIPLLSTSLLGNSVNGSFINMFDTVEIHCDVLDYFNQQKQTALGLPPVQMAIEKPKDKTLHTDVAENPMKEETSVRINNGFSATLNYYIFYIASFGNAQDKMLIAALYGKANVEKIVAAYQPAKSYLQSAKEIVTKGLQGLAALTYQYVFVPSYNLVAFNVNVLNDLRRGQFTEVNRLLDEYRKNKDIKNRDKRLEVAKQNLNDVKKKYAELPERYATAKTKVNEKYVEPYSTELNRLEDDWILLDEAPLVEMEKNIGVLAVHMASLKKLIQIETKLLSLLATVNQFADQLSDEKEKVQAHLEKIQTQIKQCIEDDDWSLLEIKDGKEEAMDWHGFCEGIQTRVDGLKEDQKAQKIQVNAKKKEFVEKKLRPICANVSAKIEIKDDKGIDVYTLTFPAIEGKVDIIDKYIPLEIHKNSPQLSDVRVDLMNRTIDVPKAKVDTFILATILAEIEAHPFKLHWGGVKGANGKKYSHGAFAIKNLIEEALRSSKPLTMAALDHLAENIEHILLQKGMSDAKARVKWFGRRDDTTTDLYARIASRLSLTRKLPSSARHEVNTEAYQNTPMTKLNSMLRNAPIGEVSKTLKKYEDHDVPTAPKPK